MKNGKFKISIYVVIVLALFLEIISIPASAEGIQYPIENKILYINGKINFDSNNDSYTTTLINKKISSGTLKDDKSFTGKILSTELKLSFLDSDKKAIKIKKGQNPLTKQVESVGVDKSTLSSTIVNENRGAFQIRTNYDSNIRYLKVEMLNKSGQVIQVGLINIDSFYSKNVICKAPPNGFEVVKIVDNGPDDEKINLVIMGDGFTAGEQDRFLDAAKRLGDYILNNEAYVSSKYKFNIYAIKVISNASGAADDPSTPIDNYFGSTYNYYGIRRLLVPTNNYKVYDTLQTYTPQYDQGLVLVNSEEYGGSGGSFATSSLNESAGEIIVHEMGHSFAGLSDEYWAGDMYAGENINFTQNNDPNTVRWKTFLGVKGVGIYEVEPGYSWYIPHQCCKMRYLGPSFCEVCLNAHKNKIHELLPTALKGDINDDGCVDISDLAKVAKAYNVRQGDAKWNTLLDVKADKIIDIYDLTSVSRMIRN